MSISNIINVYLDCPDNAICGSFQAVFPFPRRKQLTKIPKLSVAELFMGQTLVSSKRDQKSTRGEGECFGLLLFLKLFYRADAQEFVGRVSNELERFWTSPAPCSEGSDK